MYRVLRSHLRSNLWPSQTSVAVLSAEHGLIGGLASISNYDRRMDKARATELAKPVRETLSAWATQHRSVSLFLGKDYLPAIEQSARDQFSSVTIVPGMIGEKLSQLKCLLQSKSVPRPPQRCEPSANARLTYFLPDWDDFVDADFDFEADEFSAPKKADRHEKHLLQLMRPAKLADGILVSLAQQMTSKGMLRAIDRRGESSLRPRNVREHFKLSDDQWAFGDCGAFSYSNEREPPISPQHAAWLYNLYGFDLGASVDHIPLPFVVEDGVKRELSMRERRQRIAITRRNAADFIDDVRANGYPFRPVGIIQGLTASDYADQLPEYIEMGYEHIALGGLVPRSDAEVAKVVQAVTAVADEYVDRPWLHLFGIFRPKLQTEFRRLRINSFDSATYLRKSWLRSDQNYLGTNGQWYAAIRVPQTSDPRTRKRLAASGVSEGQAHRLERSALDALAMCDEGLLSPEAAVRRILKYDNLLLRADESHSDLRPAYLRTLSDKPWEDCDCPVCRGLGVHALVFRGLNRNKRRGAHNTLQLYRSLSRKRSL